MKNKIIILFIANLIVLNTIKTFAAVEYANDSLVYKHEISLDISSIFQGLLIGEGGISTFSNNYWTLQGLNYKMLNKKNNAIGFGINYRFISGGDPPKLLEVNDTSKIFYSINSRRNDYGLNISYEFRRKIKKIEFFYGASLFGYKNYHQSSASKFYYYGNDYLMNHIGQSVIDTSYSDRLSTVSYQIGINLNTGVRFPISNHFTFITALSLPFYYDFGETILFNIYSQKLEKSSYNYFNLAEVIQGRFSIAYLF